MAGDWLKFECNLPEKPEVLAITTALGGDDPDLTVGRLMRLFRWFDQHTVNGNAPGVTGAMLDRVLSVPGLAEAVARTGWLTISEAGVALQRFDKHNGATAKSRAQTAKRVATHRDNARDNGDVPPISKGSNAPTVTGALAREEKRREEDNPLPPGFARFWLTWPKSERKEARGECLKAWSKAKAEPIADTVIAHVERQKSSAAWTKDGGQFIPAPLVYLRHRRWEGADDEGAASRVGNFI